MPEIEISFGLFDVTAKKDTTVSASNIQPFIDVNDLKLESVYPDAYATGEPDFWRLDGTFLPFPNVPKNQTWGLWGLFCSGKDTKFEHPITLTLVMNDLHSSLGITIEFCPYGNNYCNDLNIQWYKNDTLLSSKDFNPDRWRYVCINNVNNYNKLIITFNGMNRPYRLLKVQNVAHGASEIFTNDDLVECSLLETVDLTSATLEINTLEFTLISGDEKFNIFNPQGIFTLLQKRQEITIEAQTNESTTNYGTFFLSEWENSSYDNMRFTCEDCISIMDDIQYMGGIYNNESANTIIEDIVTKAGFGYTLDPLLSNAKITGHLPILSSREALQQIAMAIGAYVDTSRSGMLRIYKMPTTTTTAKTLTRDNKFDSTKATQRTYVSGITVTAHTFVKGTTIEELYKDDDAELGNQLITFDEPCEITTATGCLVVESNPNYAVINVMEANVLIKGNKYTDNTSVYSVNDQNLQAGQKENILDITDVQLINKNNVAEIANRIYNYYKYRLEQEISIVLSNETVGMGINVETMNNYYTKGIITSLETDMTGGFVTKVGVVSE